MSKHFDDCLRTGGVGEHVVWNKFRKMRSIRSIVDVSDDKGFQEKDIDFLIEDFHRQFTPIEVKTDNLAHETGNLAYEVSTSGNIGCFEKTQAKYIYYYLTGSNQLLQLDVQALKNYVRESQLKEVHMGDNSTGYLLPIEDLKKKGIILSTEEGVM